MLTVLAGAIVLLGGAYVAGFALAGDSVPRNAVVSGVSIGGLTSDQATEKLKTELGPRLDRTVTITAGEKSVQSTGTDLGLGIDYARAVEEAGTGRSWNPGHILTVLLGGGENPAPITRDETKLSAAVTGLAQQADVDPVDAGVAYKGTQIVKSEAKPGVKVRPAETADAIANNIVSQTTIAAVFDAAQPDITTEEAEQAVQKYAKPAITGDVAITAGDSGKFKLTPRMIAGALVFEPKDGVLAPRLDGEKLLTAAKKEIKSLGLKQPKDADITMSKGKPKIIPSIDGIGLAADDLAAAVLPVLEAGQDRKATVKATVQKAKFSTDDAKKLGVKEVIGKFTTYYPGSAYRVNNIGKAARLINGTFLKPGEVFSMNQTLGFRSTANGWMTGGAIDGGKVVQRMGGGISQATTTTFNAIFFAGLEDIYHKPHSLYFSRYPMGREATLDWKSVDMKFKNNTPYGVVLQAFTTGGVGEQGSITVRVWSTKIYTVKASKPVQSNWRGPGPVQYDPSPGCVPQGSMSGFDVRFNRLFYKGKKLVRKEPFKWSYSSLTPVVCRPKPK